MRTPMRFPLFVALGLLAGCGREDQAQGIPASTAPVTDGIPGTAAPATPVTRMFPADRVTTWHPGVPGGVPARSKVCATLSAARYGNGVVDATVDIQAAIESCPTGQVVLLSAGTFTINSGNIIMIDKGVTLRGAGAGQTTLQKTDGAKPGVEATGSKA